MQWSQTGVKRVKPTGETAGTAGIYVAGLMRENGKQVSRWAGRSGDGTDREDLGAGQKWQDLNWQESLCREDGRVMLELKL